MFITKKIFLFLMKDIFFFLPITNWDGIIRKDSTLNPAKNHAGVFISAVQAEAEFSQSKRSSASNVA